MELRLSECAIMWWRVKACLRSDTRNVEVTEDYVRFKADNLVRFEVRCQKVPQAVVKAPRNVARSHRMDTAFYQILHARR